LNDGSVLNIGAGVFDAAIIASANNVGTVNFTETKTLNANIGSADKKADLVNIAENKSLTNSAQNIYANRVNLDAGSSLNLSSSGTVNADVALSSFSQFNVSNLSNFNGNVSGGGIMEINGGGVIGFNVGGLNSALSGLYLINGVNDITNSNIYAANTSVTNGSIILNSSSGNNFSGNLMIASALIDLGDTTHHVAGDLGILMNSTISTDIKNSESAGSIIVSGSTTFYDETKLNINVDLTSLNPNGGSYLIASSTNLVINENLPKNYIAKEDISINQINGNTLGNFRFYTEIQGNNLVLKAENLMNLPDNKSNHEILSNILGLNNPQGNIGTIKDILFNSDSSTLNQTLEQLNVQIDGSLHRISFDNTVNITDLLLTRISNAKGVASGDCGDNKTSWVQVFGSKIKQDDKSAVKGYDASSNGFALGFDREAFEDSLLGFSVSYAKSEIDSNDNLKSTNIDTYQASIYGNTQLDSYFVNGAITYSFNEYSSNRKISVINSQATAKYNGNTYAAKVELGRNYKFADAIITPTIALTAARNQINDYSETGAGNVNLAVKNNDTSLFEARFGTKITKQFVASGRSKINPSLKLSYGYDFIGDKQRVTANFVGQSNSFTSSSNSMPQGSLRANFATEIFYMDSFSFDLEYGFDYRNSYQAHSGSVKGKYQF